MQPLPPSVHKRLEYNNTVGIFAVSCPCGSWCRVPAPQVPLPDCQQQMLRSCLSVSPALALPSLAEVHAVQRFTAFLLGCSSSAVNSTLVFVKLLEFCRSLTISAHAPHILTGVFGYGGVLTH